MSFSLMWLMGCSAPRGQAVHSLPTLCAAPQVTATPEKHGGRMSGAFLDASH